MLIPRVFHQIWLGPDPLPEQYARFQETWLDKHPGWQLNLWTEENLPEDLRRPEVYEQLRVPAERADILRLELLWRLGGVYLDTDFECLRSIEPLIGDLDFFVADIDKGRANNALIGSVPGHPILDRALRELRPRVFYGYDKEAAGPLFFDRIVKDFPGVRVFDKKLFYARGAEAREHGYAIHHNANSWKDVKEYRIDARKAQRREQKAKDQMRRLRVQHERSEAELARLRQSTSSEPRSLRLRGWMWRRIVVLVWVVLALSLAALGSYDAWTRITTDHDNFGDAEYVVEGIAWVALGTLALFMLLAARLRRKSDDRAPFGTPATGTTESKPPPRR